MTKGVSLHPSQLSRTGSLRNARVCNVTLSVRGITTVCTCSDLCCPGLDTVYAEIRGISCVLGNLMNIIILCLEKAVRDKLIEKWVSFQPTKVAARQNADHLAPLFRANYSVSHDQR